MQDGREFTKKRFAELAGICVSSGIFTFTDFLGLDELSLFEEVKRELSGVKYTLFGGAHGTERVMVRFGDPEELGWCEDFPIAVIEASPRAAKWADKLTHRDLLGAIMNLGVERSFIGDIAIIENVAYIFVKESLATFIEENLTRAKHTDLTVKRVTEIPVGELYKTEKITVQCSSVRLDSVIARAFCLSREEAQLTVEKGLAFIDGRLCQSPSREPKDGQTVSVRGRGRFVYRGVTGTTKKGQLNVSLELYV